MPRLRSPGLTVGLAISLVLTAMAASDAWAQAPASPTAIQGRVVAVLPSEDATGVNDFFLVLEAAPPEDSGGPAGLLGRPLPVRYLIDDLHLVYLTEYSHNRLFADFGPGDLPERIGLRLTGVEVEEREIGGEAARVVVAADSLYPDWPASEQGYALAEIDPGCPAADFRHRYLEVPVSYDHPEWGTFELYYELSSDFDPSRPTVIVPTDGQRTFSQVGQADRWRELFGLWQNVATYEYRGMDCARIPGLLRADRDWGRTYEALKLANVVEDIERIRRDLPGGGPTYVLGGSGTAMVGLEYLAKYHDNVDRAFLMSFFRDAESSSVSGVAFFRDFLAERGLTDDMARIRATLGATRSGAAASAGARADTTRPVALKQLLFLTQRLLYYDQDEAAALIEEVATGTRGRYDHWTEQLGTVDFFVRSAHRYRPWVVVFMWETNIPTSPPGVVDINWPFLEDGRPIAELVQRGAIEGEKYGIQGLGDVSTAVLLAAGTLDQVAPVAETAEIHRALPYSRLAIFEAYHTLARPAEARAFRNRLIERFFRYGAWSDEMEALLGGEAAKQAGLVEVR